LLTFITIGVEGLASVATSQGRPERAVGGDSSDYLLTGAFELDV